MDTVSEFPRFIDGDVTVVVSASKIYRLHSRTLSRLSPTLAQLIEQYPAAKLTAAAKRDGCTPYRFELRAAPYEDGICRLVRVRVSDNGKALRESDPYSLLNVSSFGRVDGSEKYWDWLLGCFYNIAPRFEGHNLATVLSNCMGLIDVADTVDAAEHVREHIDLALLRQDQTLWQSIASSPAAWTELGCRLHSPTIFEEGVIHLVGLWQKMTEDERNELRPEIRQLVNNKWQELDLAKQAIDIRILGHYPAFLSRCHIDKPHRTSYSTDIYMWMVISFFRHWYAQAISEGRGRVSEDGGFAFYNKIALGGDAYLHHEDFKSFHQYFPMSSKACNVLEANMNVFKEEIRSYVQDLVNIRTRVKNPDFQINWLTCAVIDKTDYPWEKASKTQAAFARSHIEHVMGLEHQGDDVSPLTPVQSPNAQTNGYSTDVVGGSAGCKDTNGVFSNDTAAGRWN